METDTLPPIQPAPSGPAPIQSAKAQAMQAPTGAAPAVTDAVVLRGDGRADFEPVCLTPMAAGDILVETMWSGISTGTERMFWSGEMPPFPGLGYPLVPGYESVGRVLLAPAAPEMEGEIVFVPGASCYSTASGLFGATAAQLIVPAGRVTRLGREADAQHTLLALSATAHHAILRGGVPDLIIGHGVLGRLAARLAIAMGHPAPTVWEINPARRMGEAPYSVIDPAAETRRDYAAIMDLSGDASVIDAAIAHAARGASITLAGFYKDRPGFAFPPAFMKEISLHVAAEWTAESMAAVLALLRAGALDLGGLITHTATPRDADAAYRTAFQDASCLKLVLDWRGHK